MITQGNMERRFQDVPGVCGGSRTNAMDDHDRENVTALISEARAGGKIARDRLFRAIYEEFHRIAKVLMGGEHCGHSLHPSDVVNEAVIRLLNGHAVEQARIAAFSTARPPE